MKRWIPLFAWMVLIFGLSSIPEGPGDFIDWPEGTDKVVHFFEYGILAILFSRGLGNDRWRRGVLIGLFVVLVGLAVAVLDELYQSLVPGRDSSPADFLADVAGVVTGALVMYVRWRASVRKAENV